MKYMILELQREKADGKKMKEELEIRNEKV